MDPGSPNKYEADNPVIKELSASLKILKLYWTLSRQVTSLRAGVAGNTV